MHTSGGGCLPRIRSSEEMQIAASASTSLPHGHFPRICATVWRNPALPLRRALEMLRRS
jgi:hypothetical protein